ncbi:hypothetical protein B7494_g5257 [Chlorociboria aeruginascens]|nr:hypothetical protein B7494_g5257 [Chlorociboria aeruginascens]
MATFAKSTFSAVGYAAFRPTYPTSLFRKVLSYHSGPSNLLLDLGCGHGLISRELSPSFKSIIATDPSAGMIKQAISSTPSSLSNISFREASAEDLSFLADGSLDMVVAGQAAHWFDYSKVWPELKRKMRKGGTLAFWGYKDNLFVDYPAATKVFDHFCYGPGKDTMGPYWEQPGRSILRDLYKDIVPPEEDWEDVHRFEYEPDTLGKESGRGEVLMYKTLKLGEMSEYVRTFSSYHSWQADHPKETSRASGGTGDVVDVIFDEMLEVEPDWKTTGENWRDFEVATEWGSVILLARFK